MTSRGTKYWNSGTIPLIAPEILGDIIAEVADLGIVIDDNGVVLSLLANPDFDGFKRLEHLENKDLRASLSVESVPKFDERLGRFLNGETGLRPIELNHSFEGTRWEMPVRYSLHHIGPDGAILLLGRDLRPIAEMQQQLVNAQLSLEQDYEAQREYEMRFRVTLESSPDPIVIVSMQTGKIEEANRAAEKIAGTSKSGLVGSRLSQLISAGPKTDLLDVLSTSALADENKPVAGQILSNGEAAQFHPIVFRAAGERTLFCRITRQSADGETPNALQRHLSEVFDAGPDAIVFTDEAGQILSMNDAFLDILGNATPNGVKGASLADFLQRGSVDLKVMMENANRSGRMRLYSTKLAGEYGAPRQVDIAVTSLTAGEAHPFAFVIREASQSDPLRNVAQPQESMQSVIELVGSATLKEIVAETTNVVEKMCVETAIELTMNNRVAAADMLGLSRQSLYVKLRKFGMLEKDGKG